MKTGLDHQARVLLEASPDAMVAVDASGIIRLVNDRAISLFGYEYDELVGQPIEVLLPKEFEASHAMQRQVYLSAPRIRTMGQGLDLRARRRNGEEFPVEISLSPIHTPRGLLVLSAIHDISEHKETEHRLATARDIAQKATLAKTRFLAAASHDLRQPLQSLSLYLSVITRTLEDEGLRSVCDKMQNSLVSMRSILDALLDISKLDGGSVRAEIGDVPLRELLERIVNDNMQQAVKKGLTLRCEAEHCVVRSDPALLERVIENFVTNAVRYTEKGGITIGCQFDGQTVRITVTDTGVGIAADALEKIFDEYYQLDNPARDRRKGLGLGLAIVKHIAQLLEHSLEVESRLGSGSTFAVSVPLVTRVKQEVRAVQPFKSLPFREGKRKSIVLLVDDDPAIVDASVMLLESASIEVHTASNGDDALAKLAAGVTPDIIVSDYRLPEYSGIELIRRARKVMCDTVPTVLMTGDTSAQQIENADLPDCTVMHKPFDSERLIAIIQSATP